MFRRLSNLVRGFVGLFVGGLEKQNPEALLAGGEGESALADREI